MAQVLRVDETIASRTVESDVSRNLGVPADFPDVERVVSVNARVEISSIDVGNGYVVINGIIRATVYYAPVDNPSNVVSIRRSFTFSDRVTVSGAYPGLEAMGEALITDIDFNVINNRTIGLEFTITTELDLTSTGTVPLVEEREGINIRREKYRIRRSVRERNYTRELEETLRIPSGSPDIRRVVDVDNTVQISEITTGYDNVRVRGVVKSDLLYVNEQGQLQYTSLTYGINETFPFSGVTPEMTAYVETNIVSENVNKVDSRRVKISSEVSFTVLVIAEEMVEIPTGVISPTEGVYPVSRTVIVERVVTEERTRVSARDTVAIPQGNPDIARVISASGNIRGGSIDIEAQNGGVLISGTIDANIIYVAALPDQPVYFAPARINFSTFINVPGVEANMQAYADLDIDRITASEINARELSVRAVLDVNLLVTERVRVPVVTGISEQPTQPPTQPSAPGQGFTYIVKSGDTLYLIAQRFGISVERLIAINNITNPANLQVGQSLFIPRT